MFCANRSMIADEANTIKASINPFHHIERLMPASNQRGMPTQVLWVQVTHVVMRVVDDKLRGSSLDSAINNGVDLIGEQTPPLFVFSAAFDYLFPGNNAARTFEIGGKEELHIRHTSSLSARESLDITH